MRRAHNGLVRVAIREELLGILRNDLILKNFEVAGINNVPVIEIPSLIRTLNTLRPLSHPEDVHTLAMMLHEDNTYRVEFKNNTVDVICFGTDMVDNPLEGIYDSIDELPQWLQERIAVLSMLPVARDQTIDGIGSRINETIYWALKPTM